MWVALINVLEVLLFKFVWSAYYYLKKELEFFVAC